MNNLTKAGTPLSQQLASSIPRKVYSWLESLGEDLSRPGCFGWLDWDFSIESGKLTLDRSFWEEESLVLTWEGDALNAINIACSDSRIEDVGLNLEWFTELEEQIYNELQIYNEVIFMNDSIRIKDEQESSV